MQNRGQGAIEYLLIIGAAILVVAVVIIAISGLLLTATEDTSQGEYQDSYADLKSEHIGFPISIKPGEHTSFTLAIQPKNNSLTVIFSGAEEGTIVKINYGTAFEKFLTGWNNGGENAKINQGDVLEIIVPETATKPLTLSIKGNYTKLQPKKVYFNCSGNSESHYIQSLMFEPKIKDPKIIFKDFFDKSASGSYLYIGDNQSSSEYYWYNECIGESCTSLGETGCNDTGGYCTWSTGEQLCKISYPEWGNICGWFNNYWSQNDCLRMGCQLGDVKLGEQIYSNTGAPPTISIGSYISLNCVPEQIINAEIEENQSANIEYVDALTFQDGYTKTFLLKNYSCYTFQKLNQKFFDAVKDLPEYYMYVNCSRGNEYAYSYFYNYSWGNNNYFDPNSMRIYQDTVCSAYVSTNTTIQLTC